MLSNTYNLDLSNIVACELRGAPLYEFLVATILSQNTTDLNAWKAYVNLKSKFGVITPEKISTASTDEIASLIKVSGMHRERAIKIKELARTFLEIDVEKIMLNYIKGGDVEGAREELLKLPGIGYKSADITLLMYYEVPVFPVDTHIARITLRLGYVKNLNYNDIRNFWMENTNPKYYLPLHLLLIIHGRNTCKSRKPMCSKCNIGGQCSFSKGKSI
ncbi:MAG: endonuclease III [Desulfurococcaceae archaeon]